LSMLFRDILHRDIGVRKDLEEKGGKYQHDEKQTSHDDVRSRRGDTDL
jgi:hypothetical protein